MSERTIAHLSDLHFGRAEAPKVEALRQIVVGLRPDVTAISGDLTQRARPEEFEQARAFLETLPQPRIVVPGNHDIALYNLYGRFVERLGHFQRHITDDLEPFFADGEIGVLGINTSRSLTFKGGRVNLHQLARVAERFEHLPRHAIRVLVAHHPLDLPATSPHTPVRRSTLASVALAASRVDIVLSGHHHLTHFADPAEPLRVGGHSALLVQAGTAVSSRIRGELNSFNVVLTGRDRITVTSYVWSDAAATFQPATTSRFERNSDGWRRNTRA
jgi:3',5'-cyclic AMP phosphodiesterase CpdA